MRNPPHNTRIARAARHSLTRLTGVILAVTVTLAACTTPADPTPQPTPTDPYTGGVTHSWSDDNPPADAPVGISKLGDLKYTRAENAWGPLEFNRSNGSEQAGDGGTLRVGRQSFASGLGVHAPSTVTYTLPGTCSTFTAQVGVDDEVGAKGSVVFQVFGDGVKLADSGTRTGGQAAVTLSATLNGVKELKLVVTDASDGIAYDHADWGNATLDCTSIPLPPPAPPANAFSFADIAAQAVPVSEAQGEMVGGKLYEFGGFDLAPSKSCCTPTNRAQVYDAATNKWSALPVMPGTGVTHAGMAAHDATIYYAGGYVGQVAADGTWAGQIFGTVDAWSFETTTSTYTRLPNLPVTLAAGQLEYVNGTLHYFGGTNTARTQDLGTHYVLDVAGKATAWIRVTDMPHPRHHMGSAVLNGKIYAIGGQTGHDQALITQTFVEVYDPATDSWTELTPLPRARSHIANSTFVLDGRIVVAGGETSHDVPMPDVTAYDPTTNTWTALTPLPLNRTSSVAGALGHGYVFTGGNSASTGWKATAN